MHTKSALLVIVFVFNSARGYPNLWATQTQLNPVHGLYVKPSTDGVTGDLYVAATEDSAVKQWVVDQPVSFLPVTTAATQTHTVPVGYPGYTAAHDDNPQKRAVMPNPVPPSQPVHYAYAMPMQTGNQESPVASYPYAYPIPATPTESSIPKCEPSQTATPYPYQFPFQYFYPQMMNAYSNAMSILKDAGMSDDTASSVMAHAAPTWPSTTYPPYAYPMYVMAVDPSTWAQNQAATTSCTPSTSPNPQTEEESTQE